jgi:hypothetical protein
MTKGNFYLCVFLACLVCSTVAPLFSQENLGSIQGIVTDQQGGAVPSATITAVNQATGTVNTAKTEATGNYGIPFLPPGTYRVSVVAEGFSTAVDENVIVNAQATRRFDVSLQVGTVKQEIKVTSQAPMLQTATSSLQGTISTHQILELPLVNQNAMEVVLFLPGMSQNSNGTSQQVGGFLAGSGPAGTVTPAANGVRDTAGSWTADGANINAGMYNYISQNPAEDAVQEVSVQTGNYSAEFGSYAGVHVNVALKSGTNSFHGSAWEFLERTSLNSRNAFATAVSPLHQDQFGGTFGGPIRKNRTFFFGSYQGFRSSSTTHVNETVLTDAQRTGDLSVDVNGEAIPIFNDPLTGQPFPLLNGKANQIPASRISATTAAAISILEPKSNHAGPYNWQEEATFPQPYNQETIKIDHAIGSKDNLSGRYWQTKSTLWLGAGWQAGQFGYNIVPVNTWCVGMNETHTFSANTVLSTRGSWNRNTEAETYTNVSNKIDTRALFQMNLPSLVGPGDPMNVYPLFSVTGLTGIGTAGNIPLLLQPDENYQLATIVDTMKGAHSLKVGFELDRLRSGRLVNDNMNGQLNFGAGNPTGSGNALADFLLGLPDSSTVALKPIVQDLRHTMVNVFVADRWRVTPKLTVDAGLRYEMDLPLNETRGRVPGFSFDNGGSFIQHGNGEGIWQVRMRNFAPRLGLTYEVTPTNLVRAAYGIFYNFPPELEMTFKGSNPPFVTTYNFASAPGAPLTAANAFPIGQALAGGVVSPQAFQTYVQMPQVHQWSFDVQHSFSPTLMLDVGYVGNRAYDFGRSLTLNTPLTPGTPCPLAGPTPGCTPKGDFQTRRPLPGFGPVAYYAFDSVSTYEGLQIKMEKRTSHGLSLLGSYTWSKTLDMSANELAGYTYNPLNLNSFYGPSEMDLPNILKVAFVYQLPVGRGKHFAVQNRAADLAVGGWQFSDVTSWNTGFPFTVGYSDSSINNMGIGQLPNRICSGKISNPTIQQWFDPSCFVSPIPSNLVGVVDYGFIGNSPKGPLRGPHMTVFNLALSKSFTTFKEQYAQFRIEAYNAFNNVNYGQPASTVGPGITNAGRIGSARAARYMSIGFKYYF